MLSKGRDAMKTKKKTMSSMARLTSRRLVTTIGDLVSAAYEAVPGFGRQRLRGAMVLLTRSPLAERISPQLRFVP